MHAVVFGGTGLADRNVRVLFFLAFLPGVRLCCWWCQFWAGHHCSHFLAASYVQCATASLVLVCSMIHPVSPPCSVPASTRLHTVHIPLPGITQTFPLVEISVLALLIRLIPPLSFLSPRHTFETRSCLPFIHSFLQHPILSVSHSQPCSQSRLWSLRSRSR